MTHLETILTIQGWFYIATGIWPVIHMNSFEQLTGRKTDKWLVKTVGLMITASGLIFWLYREEKAAVTLAILNALFLAGIDIYYSWRKVIRKIYLLDAVVELGFVGLYLLK